MARIFSSLLTLSVFAVIAAVVGRKEPANVPFIVFFTGAVVVLALSGAVSEIKGRLP